jgi:hypothetical protein
MSVRKSENAMIDLPGSRAVENTPEYVAYQLLERVADLEGVALARGGKDKLASRKWLLDTYAECLDAARGARRYAKTLS